MIDAVTPSLNHLAERGEQLETSGKSAGIADHSTQKNLY